MDVNDVYRMHEWRSFVGGGSTYDMSNYDNDIIYNVPKNANFVLEPTKLRVAKAYVNFCTERDMCIGDVFMYGILPAGNLYKVSSYMAREVGDGCITGDFCYRLYDGVGRFNGWSNVANFMPSMVIDHSQEYRIHRFKHGGALTSGVAAYIADKYIRIPDVHQTLRASGYGHLVDSMAAGII